MNAINFIAENWGVLLLGVVALSTLVVAVVDAFKGNKSVVMNMLYALVTEAERQYGGGTGSLKLASVIDQIYPKLPAVIKMFITDDVLKRWVEEALAAAKEEWKKNLDIAAYIAPNEAEADGVDGE